MFLVGQSSKGGVSGDSRDLMWGLLHTKQMVYHWAVRVEWEQDPICWPCLVTPVWAQVPSLWWRVFVLIHWDRAYKQFVTAYVLCPCKTNARMWEVELVHSVMRRWRGQLIPFHLIPVVFDYVQTCHGYRTLILLFKNIPFSLESLTTDFCFPISFLPFANRLLCVCVCEPAGYIDSFNLFLSTSLIDSLAPALFSVWEYSFSCYRCVT